MAHPAFPEESSTTLVTPNSFALLIRTEAPRSLYAPGGKSGSSWRSNPAGPRSTGTIGVIPSPKDTMLASSTIGRASRYRHIVGLRPTIFFLSRCSWNRTSRRPPQSHRHFGAFIGYVVPQDLQRSPSTFFPPQAHGNPSRPIRGRPFSLRSSFGCPAGGSGTGHEESKEGGETIRDSTTGAIGSRHPGRPERDPSRSPRRSVRERDPPACRRGEERASPPAPLVHASTRRMRSIAFR